MNPKLPKTWRALVLPPHYLAGLAAVLLGILFGTAYFELNSQKQQIEHVMHEEAALLIKSLSLGAENVIMAYNEIKDQLAARLLNNLRLLDRMDRQQPLTSGDLARVAQVNALYRINIYDKNGDRVAFSHPPEHDELEPLFDPRDILYPILSGEVDSLIIGLRESRFNEGRRFAAALARSRGGALVANVDAAELLDLRRRLGVGRLIQHIGASISGIDYIVWQDTSAIISATANVTEMSTIDAEPFLQAAMQTDSVVSRFTMFDDREVFEVVERFSYLGSPVGLIRVGLRTDHIDAALTRLRQRFVGFAALLFVGGLIIANLFVARQHEMVLERAYQQIQTFSSKILDSMAEAVVAVDASLQITSINRGAESLFGISPQTVVGQSVTAVLPSCSQAFTELLETQRDRLNRELTCRIKDRDLQLEASFSVVYNHDHQVEGIIAVLRDETETRSLQQMIQRQEKFSAMGKLASGVAHEIRNPLNAIGILAQRLDLEFTPTAGATEYRQLVKTIFSEVQRMNEIIQRFLKFARPAKLNTAVVTLSDFLHDSLTLLRGEAEARSVKFATRVDCNVAVEIDRDQMQQVLLNLVRNATEATPAGGQITVSCGWRATKNAVIAIADTGEGIAEQDLARIFDLYFTTKKDGTGMGLSIANQIVQAHGGTIEVESRKGHGTVFTVVLPVARGELILGVS